MFQIFLKTSVLLLLLVCLVPKVFGAEYVVKRDGSGKFTTIQACADSVKGGDTCIVYPGIYDEHVNTSSGGADDNSRVIFKAQNGVTMQGFDIKHAYVTIDGFDITGYAKPYQGLIQITAAGSNCEVLNNALHDSPPNVSGVLFSATGSSVAADCVVRGNRLSRINYPMLNINGDRHLFENNVLEYNEGQDYIRLFGSGTTFRRNVFWRGSTVVGLGNHPDFLQNFGVASLRSENHLFEENWITDLAGAQFAQLNSGDGIVSKGVLYGNVRNIIFRRNVIANIPANGNIGIPGVRFENNTFLRMAYSLAGVGFGGSLTRGNAPDGMVVNNAFINSGNGASGTGYYFMSGAVYSLEVIGVLVTHEGVAGGPISRGIFAELQRNGYINSNGWIQGGAGSITSDSQLILSPAYTDYRAAVYETLASTVRLNATMRDSFYADYNYVYPAKPSGPCEAGRYYANQKWCEEHGINGGDGRFANLLDLLGPDGIPFTLDDGLKPTPSSPLCGKGLGGTDIGAYSCDPRKIFADSIRTKRPPPSRLGRK